MENISKLFGLGICIATADIVLAQAGRKDVAYFITIAGVGVGLAIVIPQLADIFNKTTSLFGF